MTTKTGNELAKYADPGQPPHSELPEPQIGCPKCLVLTAEFQEATGIIEYNEEVNHDDDELPDDYPAKVYICSRCHTRIILPS